MAWSSLPAPISRELTDIHTPTFLLRPFLSSFLYCEIPLLSRLNRTHTSASVRYSWRLFYSVTTHGLYKLIKNHVKSKVIFLVSSRLGDYIYFLLYSRWYYFLLQNKFIFVTAVFWGLCTPTLLWAFCWCMSQTYWAMGLLLC